MKFNLFGFRVMVVPVKEKTGTIVVPSSASVLHRLGRVVAVGNGRVPGQDKAEQPLVTEGDLVYFQSNDVLMANQTYWDGAEGYTNLHQGDLIAKLTTNDLCFENFIMLGRWVLVAPRLETPNQIIVPETVQDPTMIKFTFIAEGNSANLGLRQGTELILNAGRVNAMRMRRDGNMADFAYVDRDFVLGTVDESS